MFNHSNMARRALKNIALGLFCLKVLGVSSSLLYDSLLTKYLYVLFVAYLASLEHPEITELVLHEYKTATNMTEQFAALAAIAQNHGKTRDDVLDDFYSKWQHDFLVCLQ